MSIHQFHSREPQPHMTGTTWQHRLDSAHSPREVLSAARDFVAALSPAEVFSLPEPCRPPAKFLDPDDVATYAYDLVRHECAEHEQTAELVHRLARFFSHASIRLSQLTARTQESDDSRESA